MSKIAVIKNCFLCPEKKIHNGKDYCAKETAPSLVDFPEYEDLTGRLLERYKIIDKWADIPEWCPLSDQPEPSEPSTGSYTWIQLHSKSGEFYNTSSELKEYHGPSKQRRHDCLMGVRMFLRWLTKEEKRI